MVKVDIMVACGPHQTNNWWSPVMGMLLGEQKAGRVEIGALRTVSSAVPDHNKNHNLTTNPRGDCHGGQAPSQWNPEEKRRGSLTDANRVTAAHGFLDGSSEWIFCMDDDTVPPKGVISHLVGLGRELVGGVYYNNKPPYNPIAYYRRPDGLYSALYDYTHGALLEMDSIGMGCTLIHRSVFERIMAGHTLFQRPNGSLMVVENSQVVTVGGLVNLVVAEPGEQVVLTDGERFVFEQSVQPLPDEEDNRAWPFFALEYGRTEDHHFCELAAHVGIRPYLDTAVVCEHWKPQATTRQDYKQATEILARSEE